MKNVVPAFLGALVVFVWSSLSWMVLRWEENEMHLFANETEVAEVLRANAPESGLYLLPNMDSDPKKGRDTIAERMRAGPFFYGAVRPGGRDWSVPVLLIKSFLTQFTVALLIVILLRGARILDYVERVRFCGAVGLIAGIVAHVPNATWWEYPLGFTIYSIIDLSIAWFLAGFVIARSTAPPRW